MTSSDVFCVWIQLRIDGTDQLVRNYLEIDIPVIQNLVSKLNLLSFLED